MAKQGALSALGKGGMSELWARLRFLFLAIIVYRIGAHIPVPGINPDRLADLFRQNEGTILSLFNMFFRRRAGADEHLCTGDHAVHFGIDHHAIDERRQPAAGAVEEGR
nr:hypothetical protein GCM10020185_42440 [Pseudomonas brassicacearum subsp. brassicacearum]